MGFTGAAVAMAAGSMLKGSAESSSMNAQARLQNQEAQQSRAQAEYNATLSDIHADRVIGSETADFGAAGVSASGGSALAILQASAANKELQRQNIIHGGNVQAINHENQASLDSFGASSAEAGGFINAAGSLISSGIKGYARNPSDPLLSNDSIESEYYQNQDMQMASMEGD